MYNDAELAELIAKFNAVPVPPKEGEKKLESSQSYMYCNGECAAIVNTYSHNLFGITLWTSHEVIQVPQADGGVCPCGNFSL